MKGKRFLLLILSMSMPFANGGKQSARAPRLGAVIGQTAKAFENVMPQNASGNENPSAVFASALSGYGAKFPDWLDVTALNVTAKDTIDLANYDADYIAPSFSDILHDYQVELVRSLPMADRLSLDSLRRQSYFLDRYMSLNEGEYGDLNPSLKYPHAEIPLDPRAPITSEHPDFTPASPNGNAQAGAVAVSGILAILMGAGLKEAAITAFTACVSAMTTDKVNIFFTILGKIPFANVG